MRYLILLALVVSLQAADKAPAAIVNKAGEVTALPWCRVTIKAGEGKADRALDGWWDAETGVLLSAEDATDTGPMDIGHYPPDRVVDVVAAGRQEQTPARILHLANKARGDRAKDEAAK